jgi:ligand-binding sensor domain-containing protein
MKKHYLNRQIFSLLLLIFITPCYGQAGEYFFHCSTRDKAGNLWFGTGAGLYRYDAATGGFSNFTERDGLCANFVSGILEDKAGHLWFSTSKGVCRFDGKSFSDFATNEMCPYDVSLLLEDRNGNFWFGTNGYGVCRYNPISGAFTNFTKEQGLGSNAVQCMLEDKAGNLWLGERAGGVCRYDAASGKFIKVNGECFSSQIMKIIEDKTGNIWFANLYSGICRYDPSSGKFTHFTEENGLCNDTITCILEDKAGNIWIGSDFAKTKGRGGVCRYDGKSFTYFSTKEALGFATNEGLGNMDVWSMVEDNAGNIWIGTRHGLFRYDGRNFINFTHKVHRQ